VTLSLYTLQTRVAFLLPHHPWLFYLRYLAAFCQPSFPQCPFLRQLAKSTLQSMLFFRIFLFFRSFVAKVDTSYFLPRRRRPLRFFSVPAAQRARISYGISSGPLFEPPCLRAFFFNFCRSSPRSLNLSLALGSRFTPDVLGLTLPAYLTTPPSSPRWASLRRDFSPQNPPPDPPSRSRRYDNTHLSAVLAWSKPFSLDPAIAPLRNVRPRCLRFRSFYDPSP